MRTTTYATDLAQPSTIGRSVDTNEVAFTIDGSSVWIESGDQLDKLNRLHAWASGLAENAAAILAERSQNHYDLDAAERLADRVETMQDRRLLEPADPDDCDAVVAQLVEELFGNTLDDDGEMTRESRQYADAIKARVATLMREWA